MARVFQRFFNYSSLLVNLRSITPQQLILKFTERNITNILVRERLFFKKEPISFDISFQQGDSALLNDEYTTCVNVHLRRSPLKSNKSNTENKILVAFLKASFNNRVQGAQLAVIAEIAV